MSRVSLGALSNKVAACIDEGVDINQVLYSGRQLLDWVIDVENSELLVTLLKYGAYVEGVDFACLSGRARSKNTPLMQAVKRGSEDMAHCLVSYGADVNAVTACGRSTLLIAFGLTKHNFFKASAREIIEKRVSLINYLLESGASSKFIKQLGELQQWPYPLELVAYHALPSLLQAFIHSGEIYGREGAMVHLVVGLNVYASNYAEKRISERVSCFKMLAEGMSYEQLLAVFKKVFDFDHNTYDEMLVFPVFLQTLVSKCSSADAKNILASVLECCVDYFSADLLSQMLDIIEASELPQEDLDYFNELLASRLSYLAEFGDIESLRHVIQYCSREALDLNQALVLASQCKHLDTFSQFEYPCRYVECIDMLIKYGADVNCVSDIEVFWEHSYKTVRCTPLMAVLYAAPTGLHSQYSSVASASRVSLLRDIVRRLLRAGANPSVIHPVKAVPLFLWALVNMVAPQFLVSLYRDIVSCGCKVLVSREQLNSVLDVLQQNLYISNNKLVVNLIVILACSNIRPLCVRSMVHNRGELGLMYWISLLSLRMASQLLRFRREVLPVAMQIFLVVNRLKEASDRLPVLPVELWMMIVDRALSPVIDFNRGIIRGGIDDTEVIWVGAQLSSSLGQRFFSVKHDITLNSFGHVGVSKKKLF